MFIHQTKLPHVLLPRHYSCERQFALELERLFQPSWHLVGKLDDVPGEGDFLTKDVLGTPLLIRRSNQSLHCYLNVCPHRHSMLTHEPSGNCDVIKCQYHGWEFTESGKTGKIPDAKSFRPMPGGPERLTKFPIETVGPLIFVNLNSDPSPFAEQMVQTKSFVEEFSPDRWRTIQQWSYQFPANWKVIAENTVESYHLETVHSAAFQFTAAEEDMEHEILPIGTIMRSTTIVPAIYRRFADWLLPKLQSGCSHQYQLHHCFPNVFIIRIDAMLQVMNLVPLTPSSCQMEVSVFVLRAEKETWLTRLITSLWGSMKVSVVKKVLSEDAAIYPDLQRGMEHSPFKGSISTREELVFAFQEYVANRCGLMHLLESDPQEDPVSPDSDA